MLGNPKRYRHSHRLRRALLALCVWVAAPPFCVLANSNGLIRLNPSADPGLARDWVEAHGGRVVREFECPSDTWLVDFASEEVLARSLDTQWKDSGLFDYIERDQRLRREQIPTDAAFEDGRLWGLRNTGAFGGVEGVDVGATGAWTRQTADPSIIVAVIDGGVRLTHQDLRGALWRNPTEIAGNGIDDDGNGYVDDVHGINAIAQSGDPLDEDGHGSHVAGIIGATANDSGPLVGAAWGVQLMPLKFLDKNGSGFLSDAIECLDYAVANGATILNNSWGGASYSQVLRDAIEEIGELGILFVAAAGNTGTNNDQSPQYPSSYSLENVISVGAIGRDGTLAEFSNYGALSVDTLAPGVAIFSAHHDADDAYRLRSGTSMATPFVSGVAALIRSRFPQLSLRDWRERIVDSALPDAAYLARVGSAGWIRAPLALAEQGSEPIRVLPNYSIYPLPGAGLVPIYLRLTDGRRWTEAEVEARWEASESWIAFHDDGVGPDVVSGDGIYSAHVVVPNGEPRRILDIRARRDGTPVFETSLEVAVAVTSGEVALNPLGTRVDLDGEGWRLPADPATRSAAYSKDGTLCVAYYGSAGIRLSRSEDQGATFGPAVHVSSTARAPTVAMGDSGEVVVAWVDRSGTMWVARSFDDGRSFDSARSVNSTPVLGASARALIFDGRLLVMPAEGSRVWSQALNGPQEESWSVAVVDVDAASGVLFAAQGQVWVGTSDPDVRLFRSPDSGQSFSEMGLVPQEGEGASAPRIANPTIALSSADGATVYLAGSGDLGYAVELVSGRYRSFAVRASESSLDRALSLDDSGRLYDGFRDQGQSFVAIRESPNLAFGDPVFIGRSTDHCFVSPLVGDGVGVVYGAGEHVYFTGLRPASLRFHLVPIDRIVFPGDRFETSIEIENTSARALEVQLSTDVTWAQVLPTTLGLASGQSATVVVSVEAPQELSGSVSGSLVVRSGDTVAPERVLAMRLRERVAFLDSNLEAAVGRVLGQPGGAVSVLQLAGLSSLDATDASVHRLEGLEQATGLTSLRLGSNAIEDLTPLSQLDGLTSLTVDNNRLSDLSPLSGLVGLTSLLVGGNEIESLEPLALLQQLEFLSADNNQIAEVSALAGMASMRQLFLNRNQIADLGPLAALDSVTHLEIEYNALKALNGIENMVRLVSLNAGNNALENIDAARALPALITLLLTDNQIEVLPAQWDAPQLRFLDLGSNRIQSGVGLEGLPSLLELDLSWNRLGSIEHLTDLDSLELLWVHGNRLWDVTGIQGLPNLKDVAVPFVNAGNAFRFHWPGLRVDNNVIDPRLEVPNEDALAELRAREGLTVLDSPQRALLSIDADPVIIAKAGDHPSFATATWINQGPFPVSFRFDEPFPWLSIEPREGTLDPGASMELRVVTTDTPPFDGAVALGIPFEASHFLESSLSMTLSPRAQIVDAGLEAALRAQLGLDQDTLARGHLDRLTRLIWRFGEIADLSGLDEARFLREIDLRDNRVRTLAPLVGMSELQSLNMSGNPLEDWEPVASLSGLRELDLSRTTVSDLSPLAGLADLDVLAIRENELTSLAGLSGLTGLVELDVRHNRIDDLRPLATMGDLRFLDASFNSLTDLRGLEGAASLERLFASGNQLITVDALAALSALRVLDLDQNALSDVSALGALTGLLQLDLGGNRVFDAFPLTPLESLEVLWLNDNRLRRWPTSWGLPGLRSIALPEIARGDAGPPESAGFRVEGNVIDLDSPSPIADWMVAIQEREGVQPILRPQLPLFAWFGARDVFPGEAGRPFQALVGLRHNGGEPIAFEIEAPAPLTVVPTGGIASPGEMIEVLVTADSLPAAVVELGAVHLEVSGPTVAPIGFTVRVSPPVSFGDAFLEAGLLELLGISEGAVTRADLARVSRLNLPKRGIVDLSGLEGATGLRHLDLSGNAVTDLGPLAGLERVEEADLSGNPLGSLNGVEGWRELRRLRARSANIEDLSPLQTLGHLESLWIGSNQIGNLSPLEGLLELRVLDAADNHIESAVALGGLSELRELDLSRNRLRELPEVWSQESFRALWLSDNQLTDAGALRSLTLVEEDIELEGIANRELDPPSAVVRLENNYLDAAFESADGRWLDELLQAFGTAAVVVPQRSPIELEIESRLAPVGALFETEIVLRAPLSLRGLTGALVWEPAHLSLEDFRPSPDFGTAGFHLPDAGLGRLAIDWLREGDAFWEGGIGTAVWRATSLAAAEIPVDFVWQGWSPARDESGDGLPFRRRVGAIDVRERAMLHGEVTYRSCGLPVAGAGFTVGDGAATSAVDGRFSLEAPLGTAFSLQGRMADVVAVPDVADILELRRRILGVEGSMADPLAAIAEDIDGDGSRNVFDILRLRLQILGVEPFKAPSLWVEQGESFASETRYTPGARFPELTQWRLVQPGDVNGDGWPGARAAPLGLGEPSVRMNAVSLAAISQGRYPYELHLLADRPMRAAQGSVVFSSAMEGGFTPSVGLETGDSGWNMERLSNGTQRLSFLWAPHGDGSATRTLVLGRYGSSDPEGAPPAWLSGTFGPRVLSAAGEWLTVSPEIHFPAHPRIARVQPAESAISISFRAQVGVFYTLESVARLDGAPWKVQATLVPTTADAEFLIPISDESSAFFRIRQAPLQPFGSEVEK